ncbi:MAG: DUF2779 domain-containing protein [Bacteroidales bacterium]|nr:DUF2779 domain-containing protein [Bacteroidales bacterium]MCF8351923.1 DUF2779 domain-containing protein [Bacteroidales bacterium]MCF8377096.1 DUF2779 domain-containing protein [Bacteroidales bacterium]
MDEITEEKQAIFDKGKLAGRYAWKLFPDGIDASNGEPFEAAKALQKTKDLIPSGCKTIYEAAFLYDGVLCYMDILYRDSEGWKAIEVKGSTKLKDYYLDDTAVQYYVITKSGLDLADISVAYINNKYVRQGEIEPEKLFKIESVQNTANEKQEEVSANIENFKEIISKNKIPETDIGIHCLKPFVCDFYGHCWKHIPDNSVFNIENLYNSRKFDLYYNGIVDFEDIPKDYPLSVTQKLQVESQMNGKVTVEEEQLQKFLSKLKYPLYFLDFESFQPVVPLYDQSRPYQQIPFQYSLHIQKTSGDDYQHIEFLHDGLNDPRVKFIESLIENVNESGSIVVFNKTFEKMILNHIARDFPQYSEEIEKVKLRIVDLMEPFKSKHYYTPKMKGSYSIKKVLPALVPELGYDDLEISDGTAAGRAFESLLQMDDNIEKNELKRNLLEYCKMDTWAMVKILEKINELF